MSNKIDSTNSEAITYCTEELGITILGGVKLEGLDRMRVTLKLEIINRKFEHYLNNPDIANLALRHNVDLYNDVQVEKLIRKAAERLEVGTSQIAKAMADITTQLELYRPPPWLVSHHNCSEDIIASVGALRLGSSLLEPFASINEHELLA